MKRLCSQYTDTSQIQDSDEDNYGSPKCAFIVFTFEIFIFPQNKGLF